MLQRNAACLPLLHCASETSFVRHPLPTLAWTRLDCPLACSSVLGPTRPLSPPHARAPPARRTSGARPHFLVRLALVASDAERLARHALEHTEKVGRGQASERWVRIEREEREERVSGRGGRDG